MYAANSAHFEITEIDNSSKCLDVDIYVYDNWKVRRF